MCKPSGNFFVCCLAFVCDVAEEWKTIIRHVYKSCKTSFYPKYRQVIPFFFFVLIFNMHIGCFYLLLSHFVILFRCVCLHAAFSLFTRGIYLDIYLSPHALTFNHFEMYSFIHYNRWCTYNFYLLSLSSLLR